MEYFIRWQLTEKKPKPFLSQDKIVQELMAPVREDNCFKKHISSYYVTKANKTDVRLQVFVEEKNLVTLKKYVEDKFKHFVITDQGIPVEQQKIVENYGPEDKENEFRNFLQNISEIAIDLHLGNLLCAKKIAIAARFQIKPFGILEPRHYLHKYFSQNSKFYKHMEDKSTIDVFWVSFATSYPGQTPWDHFYYNTVLGLDTKPPTTMNEFAKELGITLDC